MHVLVDLNLATAVARPAVVYIYARAAQLRGVAPSDLSKNSFLKNKNLKKGAVIDTTKTRSLFGPPRSLFDTKKRGQLFWAIFWLPKVKKAGPFFLQIGRSLFAQVPIFGPVPIYICILQYCCRIIYQRITI